MEGKKGSLLFGAFQAHTEGMLCDQTLEGELHL